MPSPNFFFFALVHLNLFKVKYSSQVFRKKVWNLGCCSTDKPHLSTKSPWQIFTRSLLDCTDRIRVVSLRICGVFLWSSDCRDWLCSFVFVVRCVEETSDSLLQLFANFWKCFVHYLYSSMYLNMVLKVILCHYRS